jgi:hypothetical protein
MPRFSILKRKINDIGNQMVKCHNQCNDILCRPQEGILPRCLILDIEGRTQSRGTVIVGINPGPSKPHERNYYIKEGQNYQNVLDYWEEYIRKRKYYHSLRSFVDQLGFDGPILWTELVKCENAPGIIKPTLQTFRICTNTYLREELKYVPAHWPIIAVGGEAYKALAYLFPHHIVIGIPHPSGSYGHFSKLFNTQDKLHKIFRPTFEELWDGKYGKAIWFDAIQKRII